VSHSPDDTLLTLFDEIRSETLRILASVDEQQARFASPGLNNSILWHAGHAVVVIEDLCVVQPNLGPAQHPADWFDKFSWTSKPATVTAWPTLAQVIVELTRQRDRIRPLFASLTPERLATPLSPEPNSGSVRLSIVHALHDEAKHQGEIHLLKKLWKLRA
jgi:hypothetical protein